jgi:hypothetical protein
LPAPSTATQIGPIPVLSAGVPSPGAGSFPFPAMVEIIPDVFTFRM